MFLNIIFEKYLTKNTVIHEGFFFIMFLDNVTYFSSDFFFMNCSLSILQYWFLFKAKRGPKSFTKNWHLTTLELMQFMQISMSSRYCFAYYCYCYISETSVLFCLELRYFCIRFTCCQHMFALLQRQDAVDNLRAGKTWVLIATEVIARGMDFKGVNCVINYDFPESAAAYIHRIGKKDIWIWLTQALLPAHWQCWCLSSDVLLHLIGSILIHGYEFI